MAVEEQRFRIRRSIEEKLGVEEAAYLIEARPPGGWDALVTKEYLDLRLEALESRLEALEGRFHRHVNRLIMWLVPTVFAGMAGAGALVGAAS
jgi:hypothetical protein